MTGSAGRGSAFGHLRTQLVVQSLVVVTLVVAWSRASAEPLARDHEPWLGLGIGALLLSGTAHGLFLMGARRAVAVRRATLYRTASAAVPLRPPLHEVGGRQHAAKFAAGPTMTRYHRATCALAVGKLLRLERRRAHEAAGRRPCGVCRP